jgi:predicted XRE-type DNA-binding protein
MKEGSFAVDAKASLLAGIASDQADLSILILKSKLWSVVTRLITENGYTQKKAAEAIGVSQPRISNLMKGQIDKFSIDFFIEALTRLGYKFDLDFNPENEATPVSIYLKKAAL